MNGKLINCERETRKWRGKFEESNKALILATEGKLQIEKQLLHQQRQQEQLEKLTRALQQERTTLMKQISISGLFVPSYVFSDLFGFMPHLNFPEHFFQFATDNLKCETVYR